MRVLIWQWGRRGAGPQLAAQLSAGLNAVPGVTGLLSLSAGAEILRGPNPPRCDLAMLTYKSLGGLIRRMLIYPIMVGRLTAYFRKLAPDLAICAMPGPLDLAALAALHRLGMPVGIIVHDADAHPGDGFPLLMALQRQLIRRADVVIALSSHVAERLRAGHMLRPNATLITAWLPPFAFGTIEPVAAHDGPVRLLSFGRLLPYKGFELLEAALTRLGNRPDLALRIVGSGPENDTLRALRMHPGVRVENRWVPETEIGALLEWADAVVLPYREASQSGVAAAALAAGRRVICTRVGGLSEQLAREPLAVLCEPDAPSLAAALARLLDAGPVTPVRPAVDPAEAWREFACYLLQQLGAAFPLHAGLRQFSHPCDNHTETVLSISDLP